MKKKIKVLLFLLIILGCVLIPQLRKGLKRQTCVKEFLASLPLDERFVLEYFFRSLIQEDSIGYVLLGEKPMSFYSYLKPKPIVNSLHSEPLEKLNLFFLGFHDSDTLFHRGLEVWKKYEDRFCGRNIFFDVSEQDRELHFMRVSVINRHLISLKFDKYFHRFKNVDSSIKDVESLFDALLHNQKFKEKFYSRHDLMGICLGYGEKNADLFQKMSTLLTSMGKLGFTLERPSTDRLKELQGECALLEKSFSMGIKDHVSRKFLFNLGLGFRVDFSDPETSLLQQKYKMVHRQLTHIYENADFLEKTLELVILADNSQFY